MNVTREDQPTYSDREATGQFDIYAFSYGREAAWSVWDRAAGIAAAAGRGTINLDDWNAAALAEESVAEREALRAAQVARYHAALAEAGIRREAVELQPGVSVTPTGNIRLSAAWIEANSEPGE